MDAGCTFCRIAAGDLPASLVHADEHVLAFMDLRQFHPGHVLVIPRKHLQDVRELDDVTGAALMSLLARITRAVGEVFPNEGLSLWHSIGEAAFQEVPHLHFHVHPRRMDDEALRVYPQLPRNADRDVLEAHAEKIRAQLAIDG